MYIITLTTPEGTLVGTGYAPVPARHVHIHQDGHLELGDGSTSESPDTVLDTFDRVASAVWVTTDHGGETERSALYVRWVAA